MRDRFYSTADLARMCGVSISTIKRWTDAGLVRCVRTPGGHRKFRLQDVAEAARRLGFTMAGAEPLPEDAAPSGAARLDELGLLLLQGNAAGLAARAADRLAAGEPLALRHMLLDMHRHGMRLSEVAEIGLQGGLNLLYERARLQGADDFVLRRAEQLAALAAWHLLEHLPGQPADSPAALVASAPGMHAPLLRMLASLALCEQGWRVVDLGSDVPLAILESGMTTQRPELVVVGASASIDTTSLRDEAERQGAQLLLLDGGAGLGPGLEELRRQAMARERRMAASLV